MLVGESKSTQPRRGVLPGQDDRQASQVSVSREALINPLLGLSVKDIAQEFVHDSNSIYKPGGSELLEDTYVPKNLPHRESEVRQVLKVLSPAIKGRTPSHLFLFGKSGSGKTAVVRMILETMPETLKPAVNLTSVFVDCSRADTTYGALRVIANKLIDLESGGDGKHFGTKLGTQVLYDAIKKQVETRGGLTIIVLDELDRLLERSGDDMVFSLLNLNAELKDSKVALVATTNNNQLEDMLQRATRSRLNEERVHFPPYAQAQLLDILKARAQEALVEGAYDPAALALCAVYGAKEHGDARQAIGVLRVAARNADQEGTKVITESHIELARAHMERDMVVASVTTLPLQQKIVLYVVASLAKSGKTPPESNTIYLNYAALVSRYGLKPLHQRSIRNYLTDFQALGLLQKNMNNRGRGGGINLVAQLKASADRIMQLVEQDSFFEDMKKQREAQGGYQTRL